MVMPATTGGVVGGEKDQAISPKPTITPAVAIGFGMAGKRQRTKSDTMLTPSPKSNFGSTPAPYQTHRVCNI